MPGNPFQHASPFACAAKHPAIVTSLRARTLQRRDLEAGEGVTAVGATRRPFAERGNWSLTGVSSRNAEEGLMRGILTLLVFVYVIGIGVVLAPTVEGQWNTGTASEFVGKIVRELPVAAAWPVTLYHRMMDRPPG